jgi:hypothetical protein
MTFLRAILLLLAISGKSVWIIHLNVSIKIDWFLVGGGRFGA